MLRIRHTDTTWHEPFFATVDAVFGCGDTFRRWRRAGGWDERYEVFAQAEGNQLTSIIGVMDMRLCIGGAGHEGVQLGAVGTLPGWRGRGLSRQLMEAVLAERAAGGRPVILFANDTVLDFYPRFGFRPVAQQRFLLQRALEPGARRGRRLDMTVAADRDVLAAQCARAIPPDSQFAGRDYFSIALWHLVHAPRQVVRVDEFDAALVVSRADGRLIVHDVYSASAFDLLPLLASMIDRPVTEVEFCFNPARWLAGAAPDMDAYSEDPCFLRWQGGLPDEPRRFPDLAHT